MIQYLTPSEALRSINAGETIKYDTSEGYVEIRKIKSGKYEAKVHDFDDFQTLETDFNGLMNTLNRPEFCEAFYV